MARRLDWSIIQSNEATLTGQVLDDDGIPVDLTGLTLSFVLKQSDTSTDASGTTFTPTVTNATQGEWSLSIPGSHFATAGNLWYRLDAVDGSSNHVTSTYGNVGVIPA